jgi:two-component system, LytTR family, response regulator
VTAKIRTLVIEDEPVARARLVTLLEQESDVDLVGECADGSGAIVAIQELAPDLLFLDVQIPEMDGLEVARQVGPERMPAVVFVTAYDEYALQAFDVHAVDYLLKPFTSERFAQALSHARQLILRRRASMLNEQLLALLPDLQRPSAPRRERILVKSNGRIYFVRMCDLDYCQAAGNYVQLHVGQDVHLVRETMARLEGDLDPEHFVRIHRSTIVNIDRIAEFHPMFNGEFAVVLKGGVRLTLSRGYRDAVEGRLGKSL